MAEESKKQGVREHTREELIERIKQIRDWMKAKGYGGNQTDEEIEADVDEFVRKREQAGESSAESSSGNLPK